VDPQYVDPGDSTRPLGTGRVGVLLSCKASAFAWVSGRTGALSSGRLPRPALRAAKSLAGKVTDGPSAGGVIAQLVRCARRRAEEVLPPLITLRPSLLVTTGVDCFVSALPTASVGRVGTVREASGQWRIGRSSTRPVLKHGPRSLTCAQVMGLYET